jgi:hypothetical protein
MRSVLSFALSLAVSATLPTAFALFLAMTASLKTKYRQKTLFLQDWRDSSYNVPTTHHFLLSLIENYYFYQVKVYYYEKDFRISIHHTHARRLQR